MSRENKEKKISYISEMKQLLDPLYIRLEKIDCKLVGREMKGGIRYYRNDDLKRMFGLSNNTIVKYRQTGILPFTKLGDIFLYEENKIKKILDENKQ
jgi:hypothetical protein